MANIQFVDDRFPITLRGMGENSEEGIPSEGPLLYKFDGTSASTLPSGGNGAMRNSFGSEYLLKTTNFKSVDIFFEFQKRSDFMEILKFKIEWMVSDRDYTGHGSEQFHLGTHGQFDDDGWETTVGHTQVGDIKYISPAAGTSPRPEFKDSSNAREFWWDLRDHDSWGASSQNMGFTMNVPVIGQWMAVNACIYDFGGGAEYAPETYTKNRVAIRAIRRAR